MKRVFLIAFQQEVSTFNPVPSTQEIFEVKQGDDMISAYRGTATYTGGALSVLESANVEIVPVFSALACSAGTLADDSYIALRDTLIADLRAALNEGPPDGVLFLFHGAMSAQTERDPEGDVLERIREMLGPGPAFAMSLDLHGILTGRMLAHCPAVETLKTYPHVDFHDTGKRAARLLLAQLFDGVKPVAARVRMPLLVRGDDCITQTGLYGEYLRRAEKIRIDGGLLSTSLMIGNPFTDVPELCCQSVAVADGDVEKAAAAAMQIADGFFDDGPRIQAQLVSIDEAIRLCKMTSGTVILKDAADATSSGASGDSVSILKALIEAGVTKRILAPVVDPVAVQAALKAGIGAKVEVTIGGQCDPRYPSLSLIAEVAMLSDGHYRTETWGTTEDAGLCAKFHAGPVTVIATSRPVQLFDRSLFIGHGEDPTAFDVVIVKSPHCQPQFFDDWAETTVSVDVPGSTSARVETLGHSVAARPLYPLEKGFEFTPEVERFD